ncbi:MAG: DUF4382 domain-containing protein [Pseudomonadales bacterium]
MKHLLQACLMAGCLALAACGGGGGSGGGGITQTPVQSAPDAPGVLKIAFGDGPLDGVDQVLMEISEIRLLSDDGQQVLVVDEPTTIDLLQLRNVSELVVDAEVPAGSYSKIRLLVSSLTLVRLNDPDTPADDEFIDVDLVANGKVDLNPQGDFVISPGEDVVVEVDVDLDRAIHIVQTGNGKIRFRPVVFVKVLDGTDGRYVRLFGQLAPATTDGTDFDLCNVERLSSGDSVAGGDCLPLDLNENALVVDENGEPIDPALLAFDDYVTVLARPRYVLEGLVFDTILVAKGMQDTFEQLFGTVSRSADENGAFGFVPDGGAEVEAQLVDGAIILDNAQNLLGPDAILDSLRAELLGLNVDDGMGGSVFRTLLVHLDDAAVSEDSLAGRLVAIFFDERRLELEDTDLNPLCVLYDTDTSFFKVAPSDDDQAYGGTPIQLGDLAQGSEIQVQAYGTLNGDGCLEATQVVFEVAEPAPAT